MRNPLLLALLILPVTGGAQTQIKYRYITNSPNMSTTFDGGATSRMISVNHSVSTLTVSKRDSAGGQLFDMLVDSVTITLMLTDSTPEAKARFEDMQSRRQVSTSTVAPPRATHQILIVNGRPTMYSSGRGTAAPREVVLDSSNTFESLLSRVQGLGLLTPAHIIPTIVGAERADTFISHTKSSLGSVTSTSGESIPLPEVDSHDSTIVIWKRVSTDSVEGRLTRRSSRHSDASSSTSIATGLYRIIYDGKNEIREATCVITTTSNSIATSGNRPPSISTSSNSCSVIRIP